MSDWVILRCAGRNTLPLAEALNEAGFVAWTPKHVIEKRKPRSPAKTQHVVAMLPTFVFALAVDLGKLMRLAAAHVKPQPDFSVFRHADRIPLVLDQALDELRRAERRVRPKKAMRTFTSGETIKVPEGPFAGMTGVVESGDGKFTFVSFGGRVKVKIATFILAGDAVTAEQRRAA